MESDLGDEWALRRRASLTLTSTLYTILAAKKSIPIILRAKYKVRSCSGKKVNFDNTIS